MYALATTMPTLALSVIYCLYGGYYRALLRRQRVLCERVAYLLWAASAPEEWCDREAA
jgi:hypothetical protein